MQCQICLLDEATQRQLWRKRQENSSSVLLADWFKGKGINLEPDEVSDHFHYHRPAQPPAKRYSTEELDNIFAGLSTRKKQVVMLLSRIGGISAGQIGAFLYNPTKSRERLKSARNGAYRDLNNLMLKDLVWRQDLKEVALKDNEQHLVLWWANKPVADFVEKFDGKLSQAVLVNSPNQLIKETQLLERWRDVQLLIDLELSGPGNLGLKAYLSAANTFGPDRLNFRFISLAREKIRLEIDLLSAFSWQEGDQVRIFTPFWLFRQRHGEDLTSFRKRLDDFNRAYEGGFLNILFKGVGREYLPPMLIVCQDSTVARELSMNESRPKIDKWVSDKDSVVSVGLEGEVWYNRGTRSTLVSLFRSHYQNYPKAAIFKEGKITLKSIIDIQHKMREINLSGKN